MLKTINGFKVFIVLTVLLFAGSNTPALAKGVCVFNVPEGWVQANTRWIGQCCAGYADGLGILKEYSNGIVIRFFLGRIKKGDIVFGVIDQADGYIAGKFVDGALLPSDDRQLHIDAFDEAGRAAKKAAEEFGESGNKASAQFYMKKAEELFNQMD